MALVCTRNAMQMTAKLSGTSAYSVAQVSTKETFPVPSQHASPATKEVAINLDTVLRLAEGQNAQIALARARVQEAYTQKDVAANSWLPAINVGPAYYRHEGGIAFEDGTLIHSSFGNF